MTNREKINQMTDEEFAEWLCKQMWTDYKYGHDDEIDGKKYQGILEFLKSEAV